MPEENGIILGGLKNSLIARGNAPTIEVICEKPPVQTLKAKMETKEELIISNISKGAMSVVSMVTKLVIVNFWRIKKHMKKIIKQKK